MRIKPVRKKIHKTILIVEDELIIIDAIRLYIHSLIGEPLLLFAQNGEQAMKFMEKIEVDAIITDNKMPVMCGEELVEKIRHKGINKPIIMFTGSSSDIPQKTLNKINTIIEKPYLHRLIKYLSLNII